MEHGHQHIFQRSVDDLIWNAAIWSMYSGWNPAISLKPKPTSLSNCAQQQHPSGEISATSFAQAITLNTSTLPHLSVTVPEPARRPVKGEPARPRSGAPLTGRLKRRLPSHLKERQHAADIGATTRLHAALA